MMDEKAKWEAEKEAIIAETRRKAFHDGLRVGKRIAGVRSSIFLFKKHSLRTVDDIEEAIHIPLGDIFNLLCEIKKKRELEQLRIAAYERAYESGYKRAYERSYKRGVFKSGAKAAQKMYRRKYPYDLIASILEVPIEDTEMYIQAGKLILEGKDSDDFYEKLGL